MQELLDHIHHELIVALFPAAGGLPIQFVYIGGLFVGAGLIVVWMSLIAMGWIYLERKVSAFMQSRIGPNRVGPKGILQSLADGIKLLTKEDIIPEAANRFLYELAPLLVFAGAFIPFVVLPFSQHLVIADMDLGLFYVLAFGALEVMGVLMAGWAPNSKWSLYGGMRLAAQMISYEIPLGLSVLTVVILAGSLNIGEIVDWQTKGVLVWENVDTPWILDFLNWSIFRSPATFIAFFIFFAAGLAETKRAPFDLPEAESELVSGFHTEYSGIRFSFFFLAEYAAMYVMCLLGAALFLGGWHWPLPTPEAPDFEFISVIVAYVGHVDYAGFGSISDGLATIGTFLSVALWKAPLATIGALLQPAVLKFGVIEAFGFANMIGKAFVLLFVMLWVRWTLPRIRIDQVMHICLKVLLPIALALLLLAGFQAAVLTPQTPKAAQTTEMKPRVFEDEIEPSTPSGGEKVENANDNGGKPQH